MNALNYQFAVDAAKDRFPGDKVWGEAIHAGTGYGIFVERRGVKVCFQVKSIVKVDGRDIDNDIRNHGDKVMDALAQGFDALEKGLVQQIHRAESRKPKGLLTRLKEAVLS